MEFLNYKVDLVLKEGTNISGTITHVDNQLISLNDVIQKSNTSSQKFPSLNVNSGSISDLKVTQLPPDLLKNNKNKKHNAEQYVNKTKDVSLLDDAIVFARPVSDDDNSHHRSNHSKANSTPRGSSRTNTPKLGSAKLLKTYSNTGSVEPDWGNGNDVKDIKESNDFDFAANLAMFDKKSVFADFHKNDNVSLQNRLVGHNKLDNIQQQNPKKKEKKDKYENDEMVLDVNKTDNWDLIGNLNKRMGVSNGSSRNNSSANLIKDASLGSLKKTYKLVNSADHKSAIPLASPVQLVEVERLAHDTYGVNPSITAEVCASNLSALITHNILGGSTRLSNKKNHNLPPLVLILIGSGRCGSRAFATGRHLTNHGIRVLAYVINNDDSDKELTKQWDLFENVGGKVITSDVSTLINILTHELDTPVELIIDALQGYDDHLEDIFYQDQDLQSVKDLIVWCNEPKQKNKIMSLDIPSGIDGGSGTVLDQCLVLHSRWIISMGLPIIGLIHAYKNGHLGVDEEEVDHFLVDIGIPNKVYSTKGNLRKFDKFWFSAEFSVKLDILTE